MRGVGRAQVAPERRAHAILTKGTDEEGLAPVKTGISSLCRDLVVLWPTEWWPR